MPESPPSSKTHQVLEINLISAQDLKPPTSPRRRLQIYAVTWVDPFAKLRTRVDQIGGENPTWNDKFLFRVSPQFLASETSAVSVAIYSVGLLRDHLIGTVRFLVSNILRSGSDSDGDSIRTPSFCALQIRRPSGSFQGVMNIGAMVLEGSDFPSLNGISAIGYRDLMGEKFHHRGKHSDDKKKSKPKHADELSSESCENSCADSVDLSDDTESTTSSSSSASTALKDWNGVRELAGNKGLKSPGFLCGLLLTHRRYHYPLGSPNMYMNSETEDMEL
ncbi:hypothetical protein K1719_019130 [Acacia pycnantha]|nr:hypothetical protein K1719_019130 [Acacia pycnantha]